jgi:hypothetical protein
LRAARLGLLLAFVSLSCAGGPDATAPRSTPIRVTNPRGMGPPSPPSRTESPADPGSYNPLRKVPTSHNAPQVERLERLHDACLGANETQSYLSALRETVLRNWRETPSNFEGTALVGVALVLRATGEVESVSLSSEHPAGVGGPMLEAIRLAQPFGKLPPQASCLAGQKLQVVFRLESHATPP